MIAPFVAHVDFPRTEVKPKKERGVLIMKQSKGGKVIHLGHHRNKAFGGKIIYTVYYHNQALSKYAKLHLEYLRDYQPKFYAQLLATGKLQFWLHEIDEIAKRRFELAKKFNQPFNEAEQSLLTEVIYNLK